MHSTSIFRGLAEEYRRSLKPGETEEILNQVINRPLAFVAAKLTQCFNGNPIFLTLLSMLSGVSSGFFFAKGEYPYLIIAAVLLELMVIFDCADGQLARMTRQNSRYGKIMDGLADAASHMSIFYGVAYGLFLKSGVVYPFFLAFLSQLSLYLHIFLYDHFKNVFISITKPDYIDRLESLETLKKELEQKKHDSDGLKRFMNRLYYFFYRLEASVVSIGYLPLANSMYDLYPSLEMIDPYTRGLYYREMRSSVKVWSFLGDTTHLTLFIVAGLLNKTSLVFPALIVVTNLYMIFAIVYQRIKFRSLGLEREVLWQTRLE